MRRSFFRRLKTLMGMLVTVALLCSLGITASFSARADVPYSITIQNYDSNITYTAYQIFKGNAYKATSSDPYTLSNVKWGTNANTSDLSAVSSQHSTTDAVEIAEKLTTTADADKFAYLLVSNNLLTSSGTTASDSTITLSEPGYYLVRESGTDPSTAYILIVVGGAETVDPKKDTSTLDKTVTSMTDSSITAPATSGKADTSADYSVGDTVPFTLTATLPDNYGAYDTFLMTFHDTLSTGLLFNSNSVVVTVYANETDTTGTVVKSSGGGYMVSDSNLGDTCTFHVVILDANSLKSDSGDITVTKDSIIKVTYNATVQENAFSSNTESNQATLEYSNNPGNTNTGETSTEVTTLLDFTLTITKTKEDDTALLNGAAFTLYQEVNFDATDPKIFYEANKFYYTNDDGEWTLDTEGSAADVRTYYKLIKTIDGTSSSTFNFTGLSVGDYVLVESTTPNGYNTMEDLYFTVVTTTEVDSNSAKVTTLQIKDKDEQVISGSSGGGKQFTVNLDSKSISSTVKNTSGSEMPESGGIGTTIFYIVGGVLVVGAGVLLIVRRRMRSSDQ